jgi:hypothetical protein
MIAEDIKTSGVKIWLDEVELKVGDSLILKIADALGKSDYVVAFLSVDSIKSNWVKKELAVATSMGVNNNKVFVLPVLIGNINSKDIPLFLYDQIYIDFRNAARYDHAFNQLLKRVNPRSSPANILNIDAYRTNYLIEMAKDPSLIDWVVNYLTGTLPERDDPTERYWSYIALARIDSPQSREVIQKGFIEEKNEFARVGAKEGLELLKI